MTARSPRLDFVRGGPRHRSIIQPGPLTTPRARGAYMSTWKTLAAACVAGTFTLVSAQEKPASTAPPAKVMQLDGVGLPRNPAARHPVRLRPRFGRGQRPDVRGTLLERRRLRAHQRRHPPHARGAGRRRAARDEGSDGYLALHLEPRHRADRRRRDWQAIRGHLRHRQRQPAQLAEGRRHVRGRLHQDARRLALQAAAVHSEHLGSDTVLSRRALQRPGPPGPAVRPARRDRRRRCRPRTTSRFNS